MSGDERIVEYKTQDSLFKVLLLSHIKCHFENFEIRQLENKQI